MSSINFGCCFYLTLRIENKKKHAIDIPRGIQGLLLLSDYKKV